MTCMIWCHLYLMTCTMIARYLEKWSPVNWQWIALGGEFMAMFTLRLILSCVVWTFYKSGFGFHHLVLEGSGKNSHRGLLESPGKPQDTDQWRPCGWIGGWSKGLNDVEAKGVPRQFMARERTVMKQNFWASRLNSRESECDCLSPLLFIEFLPPQDSLGHWNSLLTRIFLVSLGPVQGKQILS